MTLLLKDHAQDSRDELAWRWRRGGATPLEAFGDPRATAGEGYAFCMYGQAAPTPDLLMQAAVPAGALCHGEPCWRKIDDSGFIYRDRRGMIDGLTRIKLETGVAGRSTVIVRGSAAALPMPTLPLQLPVTVQLQATNGECWEAHYLASGVGTNEPDRFRGKAGAEIIAVVGEEKTGGARAGTPVECRPDLVPTLTPTVVVTPGPPSGFDLDIGWTGIAHDQTGPAPIAVGEHLSCVGSDCTVDGPPVGSLLAPFPLSAGGVPICVVAEVRDLVSGMYDLDSGCGEGTIPLTARTFLVSDIRQPCPICVGDPTAGDGLAGGTCVGSTSTPGGPCDVDIATPLFGGTSRDCLPAGSSIGELDIDVPLTTGASVLDAAVDCLSPLFPSGSCFCEGQVQANACTDGVCSPTEECSAGPIDGLCSGQPFRSCRLEAGAADCENLFPGAGTCVIKFRPCFSASITRTGQCGPSGTLVATFCTPATRAAAINTVQGLPGPVALSIPVTVDPPE